MIHFISDVHLSAQLPAISRLFLDYLQRQARSAQAICILGDLFDAWLGDDCLDDPAETFHAEIADALRELALAGTQVFMMHGNRDFLLGEKFAARAGAQLISEPYLLSTGGWQFVLAHGDALCVLDVDYQKFRENVRDAKWCAQFLNKSLAERKAIALALRQQSELAKGAKREIYQAGIDTGISTENTALDVMDVEPNATEDFMRAQGYATFIHGHTHRAATHQHMIDGIHVERWVLADWRAEGAEFLAWDAETGFMRQQLEP